MQQRSSLLTEFGWLALFLAVFVVLVYAFNLLIVPHHFNDKVADTLAGLLAALIYITARAKWRR